jgi:hypothetical protein
MNGCCIQPPYAENRTSGGVGGSAGEILLTRPDPGNADNTVNAIHLVGQNAA